MKKLLTFFALLSSLYGVRAEGVQLLCRPLPDSIMLRWAPTDKQTWRLGNKYGYVVERYTILRGGKLLDGVERSILTTSPLKPQPLEVWEAHEDEKYVGIAAECIYGGGSGLPLTSPVAIGRRYQEEQNRFSFALYAADQSPLVARLSGLSLTDRSARRNEKYLYRVFIAQPNTFPPLDTTSAFTGISEHQPLPAPLELHAQWSNRQVLLSWNILYLGHIYNSYVVEKSTDSIHFAPLNDRAAVQLADEGVSPQYAYKTDSLPDNQSLWYYRVRGINAFGEMGPPCKAVSGHGRLPITQPPVIVSNEVVNNSSVALVWEYPEEMNPYIKGFNIYRSSSPTGLKRRICAASSTARSCVDTAPENSNYYAISVFDGEQELVSLQAVYAELVDSFPPAAPKGLMGTVDSLGMVYLSWTSNAESDLEGYRVYRANRSNAEFSLISPSVVRDTTFTDKVNIKTLTRQVYYQVRAIDLRQNHSAASAVLTLVRPDVIPPVAPRLLSVEAQQAGITITWIYSSSVDVARHHIYRRVNTDTVFTLLASIEKVDDAIRSTYVDKTLAAGNTYTYYLQAEDESGLFSPPSTQMQATVSAATTESVQLKVLPYSGKAKLQWTVKSPKKTIRIVIYRSMNGAPLQVYTSTAEGSFTDENLLMEVKYAYRIRAVYDDETESVLSNEVVVGK